MGNAPQHKRLTVNVTPETLAAIRDLAGRRRVSYTELIRRAVAVYDMVDKEVSRGCAIQFRDGEHVREVELVF